MTQSNPKTQPTQPVKPAKPQPSAGSAKKRRLLSLILEIVARDKANGA